MTENEAIRDLDIIRFNPHWDELVNEEYWEELMTMAIQALEEIQQYRAIGTVEDFKALKEKAEPNKVAYQGEHEKCPNCGSFHVFGKHCTECGQKIDWSE